MKWNVCKTICRFITLMLCASLTATGRADMLNAFEKNATRPRPDTGRGHAAGAGNSGDGVSGAVAGACVEAVAPYMGLIIFSSMIYGAIESYDRAYTKLFEPENADAIKTGEPLIPFARADISYRYINSTVDAIDYRLEGGVGPLAAEFNHSIYNEVLFSGNEDRMDIKRINGLYRMYFDPFVELDIGMGALIIDGEQKNTGFSFSLPVLVHFSKHAGVEFRPAWASVNGSDTSEYDIGLLFSRRYVSVKAGYRTMKTADLSLDGPYAGVSFRF